MDISSPAMPPNPDVRIDPALFLPARITDEDVAASAPVDTEVTDMLLSTAHRFAAGVTQNVLPDMGEMASRISRGEVSREAGQLWAGGQAIQTGLGASPETRGLLQNLDIQALIRLVADPGQLDGTGGAERRGQVRDALDRIESALQTAAGNMRPSVLQQARAALHGISQSLEQLEQANHGAMTVLAMERSEEDQPQLNELQALIEGNRSLVNVALELRQQSLTDMLQSDMWHADIDMALAQLGYAVNRNQLTGMVTVTDRTGQVVAPDSYERVLRNRLVSHAGNSLANYEAMRGAAPAESTDSEPVSYAAFDAIIQQIRSGHGTDTPLGSLFSSYLSHVSEQSGGSEEATKRVAALSDRLLSGTVQVGSLGADEEYAQNLVRAGTLRIENGRYVSAMSAADTRQARQMFQTLQDANSDLGAKMRKQVMTLAADKSLMKRLNHQLNAAMQQRDPQRQADVTAETSEGGPGGAMAAASAATLALPTLAPLEKLHEEAHAVSQSTGSAATTSHVQQANVRRQAMDDLYEGQAEEFKRTLQALDRQMKR